MARESQARESGPPHEEIDSAWRKAPSTARKRYPPEPRQRHSGEMLPLSFARGSSQPEH